MRIAIRENCLVMFEAAAFYLLADDLIAIFLCLAGTSGISTPLVVSKFDSSTLKLDKNLAGDCNLDEQVKSEGLGISSSWKASVSTALVNHSKMKSLLASKAATMMPISSNSLRIVLQTSLSSGDRLSTVWRETIDGSLFPLRTSCRSLSSLCSTLVWEVLGGVGISNVNLVFRQGRCPPYESRQYRSIRNQPLPYLSNILSPLFHTVPCPLALCS